MAEPSSLPLRARSVRGDDRLFLTDDNLRQASELLFFAYRYFTKDSDAILAGRGYGRAHHRVLHFVGARPGLSVAELLDILGITKQSLGRVLKPLMADGLIEQRKGERDGRMRLLHLTVLGEKLERELALPQQARLTQAFRGAGPEAVAGFRKVLEEMIDAEDRVRYLVADLGEER